MHHVASKVLLFLPTMYIPHLLKKVSVTFLVFILSYAA